LLWIRPRAREGAFEDRDPGGIYVGASFLFQSGVSGVSHPLSTFVCQRKYWCAFVRAVGRGGGIITFVVLEEFPGSVNGGTEGVNFEFMCVGKQVCTVLFSVNLFQGFTLLV